MLELDGIVGRFHYGQAVDFHIIDVGDKQTVITYGIAEIQDGLVHALATNCNVCNACATQFTIQGQRIVQVKAPFRERDHIPVLSIKESNLGAVSNVIRIQHDGVVTTTGDFLLRYIGWHVLRELIAHRVLTTTISTTTTTAATTATGGQ